MKLVACAPYAERAIRAIVEQAADGRHLLEVQVPAALSPPAVLSRRLGASRAARLSTRDWTRDSGLATVGVSAVEVPRVLAALSGRPRLRRAAATWGVVRMGRHAGARVRPEATHFLGMPAAALEGFRAYAARDVECVLHAVNAHPDAHNDVMLAHYPRRLIVPELVRGALRERVLEELGTANHVLVPSELMRAQMAARGVESAALEVIPYGVNFSSFQPGSDAEGGGRPRTGRPRLLCVGQVGYRKGIPLLLAACRGLDVDVVIAGPIVSPSCLKAIPSNARFVGPVSRAEVAALMQWADAFVLPTVLDACALVTLEAAGAGLPVITTTGNGAHELLDDIDKRIVDAGDVQALRTALTEVGPLSPQARVARSRSLQERSRGGISSWSGYAVRVLQQLDGR